MIFAEKEQLLSPGRGANHPMLMLMPSASVSGLCWSSEQPLSCDWLVSHVLHGIFFLLSFRLQAFCSCFSGCFILFIFYQSWRVMLFPKEAFLCHRREKCVSSKQDDTEGNWCPRNKYINGLSNVFSTFKYDQGKRLEKDLQIENCSVWV